jgi:hypothetical protein
MRTLKLGKNPTDLDRKPVAVLPLLRAEDAVQRSATGRVDHRGKKLPSKPGGDLQAPWPENELRDNSIENAIFRANCSFSVFSSGCGSAAAVQRKMI